MVATIDSTLLSVVSGFIGGIVASIVAQFLALARQRRAHIVQLKSPLVEAKHLSSDELMIIKRQTDSACRPDLHEQATIDKFRQTQSRLTDARAEAAYLLNEEQLDLVQQVGSIFTSLIENPHECPSPVQLETTFEEKSQEAIDSLLRF